MLNFEERIGPDLGADAPAYPGREVPQWYRDAKLGFFVHWGLYSVPAWASTRDRVPVEDGYAWHRYAEWYGNTVRIPGSPTRRRHEERYGVGTSYEDLADLWSVEGFDAADLVTQLVDAGARYVVPTAKHHEGFCLWDTATTGFNAAARGPRRDLIAQLHDAARDAGIRFGVYFSGALDWHVSDLPAIESDVDLFRLRRNDESFARYSAAQLDELIERFAPDVLWNDIEWPDAGKGRDDFAVAALLKRYFSRVPNGVVNDRWGVPYHGFLTREYSRIDDIIAQPWEATRGLGFSFGYNQDEDASMSMSAVDLISLLVDVVSKNGNLLINVGPRADGSIPEVQASAMRGLGQWLRVNGEAIYGTRTWLRFGDARQRYTTDGDAVFVHLLDPAQPRAIVPAELHGRRITWLGCDAEGEDVPDALRAAGVAVARISLVEP